MTWISENRGLFAAAIAAFDAANAQDPNAEEANGRLWPRELLYARRLTGWVLQLNPEAAEPLQLASRCQHICRWQIPRDTYPKTKPGYLKWREDLKRFHSEKARDILQQVGYPSDIITRVSFLNMKTGLPHDPDAVTLEDALCLVFLQHQFLPLIQKTSNDKVVNAVRKTWGKMSPKGRDIALGLSLSRREMEVIKKALAGNHPFA